MRKIIFILVILLGYKNVSAQKTKQTVVLNFTGKIDQYPINMLVNITKGKDTVYGEYYYAKKGSSNKISLDGTCNNNNLWLTENYYSSKKKNFVNSGIFNLRFQYENSNCDGTWRNADKSKLLPVKLTLTENLIGSAVVNYSFNLIQYKGKYSTYNGNLTETTKIKGLQIFKNNALVQTLTGFNEVIDSESNAEVILQDFNFDGFFDLKLPILFPERIKNESTFLYFIYNPTTKKFTRSKTLDELEMAEFNSADKTILKYDADGSGNEGTRYYKWIKNSLLLTKEERVFEDKPYTEISTYKIVNGKSVLLKTVRTKN